jgi:hypothetical protein
MLMIVLLFLVTIGRKFHRLHVEYVYSISRPMTFVYRRTLSFSIHAGDQRFSQ